jgi:hypothetical protein
VSSEWSPVDQTVTNSCTGETIQMKGESHTVVRDVGGGCFIVQSNAYATGVSDSGVRYTINGTAQETFCCGDTGTRTRRRLFISQGGADNEVLVTTITFTLDSDCTRVTTATDIAIECRG